MKKIQFIVFLVLGMSILTSCENIDFKEGVIVAGGKMVDAQTLNKGKQIYTEYCMACHGVNGDGKGVASKGLFPPPRNFKLGIIKFGNVTSGELTHDDAIFKLLHDGLNGTAMLPWDLQPGQMEAVWQYIKTFAPDTWIGEDKKLGEKIVPTNDPFGLARKTSAIERGKEVYHAVANCQACHMAYVTPAEYKAISKKINNENITEVDAEMYKIKPQESEHGYKTLPPDFTWDRVRSANNVTDLYIRLAAGVGGTTMPAWRGTLEDEDIWAVAYYVESLMNIRNTPARQDLMKAIQDGLR
ncbi:MAG: hypothetical protein Fur0010_24770 [Bdellovibrio sp.]